MRWYFSVLMFLFTSIAQAEKDETYYLNNIEEAKQKRTSCFEEAGELIEQGEHEKAGRLLDRPECETPHAAIVKHIHKVKNK